MKKQKEFPKLEPEAVLDNWGQLLEYNRTLVQPPYTEKELEQIRYGHYIGYKFLQEHDLTTRKLVESPESMEKLVVMAKDFTPEGLLFYRTSFDKFTNARDRDFTKNPESSAKRILERDLKKLREEKQK